MVREGNVEVIYIKRQIKVGVGLVKIRKFGVV